MSTLTKMVLGTACFLSFFPFSLTAVLGKELPVIDGKATNPTLKREGNKEVLHWNKERTVIVGWYGPGHQGKISAAGRRFNMYEHTLAHRRLPFGTKVRLVSRDGKRAVEGIVTDRGPFVRGRDFDVSYAMAKDLGLLRKGVDSFFLEKLEEPKR